MKEANILYLEQVKKQIERNLDLMSQLATLKQRLGKMQVSPFRSSLEGLIDHILNMEITLENLDEAIRSESEQTRRKNGTFDPLSLKL